MVPKRLRSLLVAVTVSLLSVPGPTWAGAPAGCPVEFACEQGVCVDGSCECPEGWVGVTCGEDIDECAAGACPSSALCVNLPGSFVCQCPADAKQCPDGSFVGREPPECEFAPCPPTPTPTSTPGCPDDVRVCPDGTVLNRDPVTCLFPECPTVPLGHLQCYDVRRVKFDNRDVDLTDELGPGMTQVRRPKTLCAPVNKNGEDPTAPTEPDHLLGYEIRRAAPAFRTIKDVVVEDQFGPLVVDLRRPDRLLVPTAKSLTGPATPLAPAMVDHYQCYAVQGARRRSSGVEVEDQFGMGTTDVKKPLRLCLPVDKSGEGILDPAARLMCYRIKTGPRVNRVVYLDNQFGAGELEVRRARELCVPVVRPEPDTLPTPTPTPTPDGPCCDPAAEPGANDNPICVAGHACCPDGTWACSIGDGATFPCGGELTEGPFGERCEACCDPADEPGTDGNPFCLEGHACCPDGAWACSIGDGQTFPCAGGNTQGPFGEVCTDP